MKKNDTKQIIIIGFAVFSIFFGAGNLIFPPQIGLIAGKHFEIAMMGMMLTGILFPMLALASVANMGSTLESMTMHITTWWHKMYYIAAILILLFGTIPRCGSVACEIGLGGIIGDVPIWGKWLFLLAFFGLSWVFAMNRSSVVDKIGKYITPILLIALLIIVALTIFNPLGKPSGTYTNNAFTFAMLTSYNTGDIGTGILCAGMFLATVKEKGYNTPKERKSIMFKSIAIAFIILAVVYCGLCYLGAQGTGLFAADTDQTLLLVGLVKRLAGYGGMVILSIAIIFATFTTSSGMIAVGAGWIESFAKEKLNFKLVTLILTIIIMFVAATGASNVVRISSPLFMFIFPMSVTMTVFGLIHQHINDGVWKGAIFVCTAFSIYDAFNLARIVGLLSIKTAGLDSFMAAFPLAGYGFAWLLPTFAGAVIGGVLWKVLKKENYVSLEA